MKYNMKNYILELHERADSVIVKVTDLDRNVILSGRLRYETLQKLDFSDPDWGFCDRIEFYRPDGDCYLVFYNEELENPPLTFGENGEVLSPQEYGEYVILVDPESLEVKQISYIG